MPHSHVELSQSGFQGVPHDDHEHVKIHKLNEKPSAESDKSHYLAAAIGEVHAGEPFHAHYHGPTVAYVIEGELHVKDESVPDKVSKLVAGDVLHIDHESHLILSSPDKSKVFGVSYCPPHLHLDEYILSKK